MFIRKSLTVTDTVTSQKILLILPNHP